MPLEQLDFEPGVNREGTDYSAKGGWVNANLVRFRKGAIEKVGGWRKEGSAYFLGIARAIHSWISLGGTRYKGIGTTSKYYVEEGGIYNDVTPIRATTSAGDVTFSATNGSSTVTVADTAHGAVNGDYVTFSGAASLGGLVTAAVLNQEYQIDLVTTANAYTITAKDADGDTVTANGSDSGNGGGSIVGTYQINVGLDTYVQGSGFGLDTWGEGTFGSASAISSVNQLRTWTHDNYGENLIINVRGAGIYRWVENSGITVRAAELATTTGANLVPTVGLQVITSETDRHLVVIGADPIVDNLRTNVVDPMLVAFSTQENELQFEPTSTNTAGSVRLSSGSFIVGAVKSRQEILIWTDTSMYSMTFIGPPLTFAVNLVNEGAGLISPKGATNAPNGVYFASKTGFYFYNGSVQKLLCTVQEYVFEDIDQNQAFKCFFGTNSEFGEVWFFYPSITDGTGEISRYVIFNYEENNWSIGSLVRYGWQDAGVEDVPLAGAQADSQNCLFQHETGFDDNGAAMTGVFAESADLDVSSGENFSFVKKIIPDTKFVIEPGVSTTPAMNVVLKRRDFPGQSLTTDSTTQITESSTYNSLRSRARQVVFRFESDDDGDNQLGYKWRVGSTRIELQPSGRR
tara:strand:- start:3392 stop:5281 length:1890 start_codon:yes stop_codon:yes gene_type:complete